MTMEVHKQCAVCAWRETCTKKHKIKESARNCADFTRDENLPPDPGSSAATQADASNAKHKQVVDPFGEG